MEESVLRRTWAEVDLDALAHNYRQARRMIGAGVRYLGVVKADAYGHGAVQVGRKLEALGADYLAVSSLDEARELRHGGIAKSGSEPAPHSYAEDAADASGAPALHFGTVPEDQRCP